MSAHEGWQFLCRLFAAGTPVLRATLSPGEVALLPHLGRAIQAAMTDQSCVLCPHCALHRAPVFGDGHGGRLCRCPDCGPVPVSPQDGTVLRLNEDWLRQKLRLALAIDSRDGIDDLGDGVWRLGTPPFAGAAGTRHRSSVARAGAAGAGARGRWRRSGDHAQAPRDARRALRAGRAVVGAGRSLHPLRWRHRVDRHAGEPRSLSIPRRPCMGRSRRISAG